MLKNSISHTARCSKKTVIVTIFAVAVLAMVLLVALNFESDNNNSVSADPATGDLATWVSSGSADITDERINVTSETLKYVLTMSATAGDKTLTITIPRELNFSSYNQTDTDVSASIKSYGLSSADAAGNRTLTITFYPGASGLISLNISVAPVTTFVYGGQTVTITSQTTNFDNSGGVVVGINKITFALLTTTTAPGTPAIIGTSIVALNPNLVYNGIETQMALKLSIATSTDVFTYQRDSSYRVKNFTVTMDLNLMQVNDGGSTKTMAQYCADNGTTISDYISINVAATNSGFSHYNNTFAYSDGVVSFVTNNFGYSYIEQFYATFNLPAGVKISFVDAMFTFSAQQNGLSDPAALLTRDTTSTTYFRTFTTSTFTLTEPSNLTDFSLMGTISSTNTNVIADGSEQELFKVFVKNGPYDYQDLTFTITVPAGMIITQVRLPSLVQSSTNGTFTNYSGPVTITYNSNSQVVSAYNGWTVLTTPIDGGTTGTTFTVTIAELGPGQNIFYSEQSTYGLAYGLRFKGYLEGTAGSAVNVTIPNTSTNDITAFYNGGQVSVTDNTANSVKVTLVGKTTVDSAFGSFTLLNNSNTTLNVAIKSGDVFKINVTVGCMSYPYTSMLDTLRSPVLYFTIPDIFVGNVSKLQSITLADLYLAGAPLTGYDLSNVEITNLGPARVDSGFSGWHVIKISFPGLVISPTSNTLTVRIGLTLSEGYSGATQAITFPNTSVMLGTTDSSTYGIGGAYSSSAVVATTRLSSGIDDLAKNANGVSNLLVYGETVARIVSISPAETADMTVGIDTNSSDGVDDFQFYNPLTGSGYPSMMAGYGGAYEVILRNNTSNDIDDAVGYFVLPHGGLTTEAAGALTATSSNGANVTVYYSTGSFSTIDASISGWISGGSDSNVTWTKYTGGDLPVGITVLKFDITDLPVSSLYTAKFNFILPTAAGGGISYDYGDNALGQTAYDFNTGTSIPQGKTAALTITKSLMPTITFPQGAAGAPDNALFSPSTTINLNDGDTDYDWAWCTVSDDLMSLNPGNTVFAVSLNKSASTVVFTPANGDPVQNWTFNTFTSISNTVEGTYVFNYVTTADTDGQTGTAARTVTVEHVYNTVHIVINPSSMGIVGSVTVKWVNSVYGTRTDSGDVHVPAAVSNITLVAAGQNGYLFSDFVITPVGSTVSVTSQISPAQTPISGGLNVVATFVDNSGGNYVTLTVTAGTNGTTTLLTSDMTPAVTLAPSPDAYTKTVEKDSSVTLTAEADSTYAFDGWQGDFASSGAVSPLIVTMDTDYTTATLFSSNASGSRVVLTITAGENGTTTVLTTDMTSAVTLVPSPDAYEVTVDKDSEVTLTAEANPTYAFDGWQDDFASNGTVSPLIVTMDTDYTTATSFSSNASGSRVILTITAGDNGTTTVLTTDMTSAVTLAPSPDAYEVTVNKDSEVTLTAEADPTYAFIGWQDDLASFGMVSPVYYTINQDTTTGTEFTDNSTGDYVTLVITGGDNGTTSVNGTPLQKNGEEFTYTFDVGAAIELSAVADKGCTFAGWQGDLESQGTEATLQYVMEQDVSTATAFNVQSVAKSYYITATADSNSTIDPIGLVVVSMGGNQTFTFSANDGYHIVSVLVDGIPLSQAQIDSGTYTFNKVMMNHSIQVSSAFGFAPLTTVSLTIDISPQNGGYAEYSLDGGNSFYQYISTVAVPIGSNVSVRADANDGFDFQKWMNGSTATTTSDMSLGTMSSSVHLTLYFTEKGQGGNKDNNIWWWVAAIIILLVIAGTLLWFLIFWRRYCDVIKPENVIGKDRAHRKSKYQFTVEGSVTGAVSYRIGKDGDSEWKVILPSAEGKYTIQRGEITDDVTIEVR